MSKIFKIAVFCAVCFNPAAIFAQLNEYLDSENNRIENSKQTEIEIKKFINDNFNHYILSQKVNEDIIQHLRNEEEFTDAQLDKAIVNEKIYELRKLFFHQNPDKKENYLARHIPVEIQQQCVNGDFENNTAGYSFWSDAHPQPGSGTSFFLSCATPTAATALNVVTPAVNDFNATVTLVDNTSPGFIANDPTLAALTGGLAVNMPTLAPNGGHKCIKLNNEEGMGSSDITTVSRYFPSINQATLDFNFALVMDNKIAHGQEIQPFFRVRALDQNHNVVDEICIVADPNNCLFNVINVNSKRRVLYTDWICARLNVGDILNQPGTIEFTVSDCQPSAHFGTVYIDNICGSTCSVPLLGSLTVNPTNINCPDIISEVPIQVCGTFQAPLNSTLSTITLNIVQNGNPVATINTPTQLTANAFCFSFLPSLFGANPSGDFEFQVSADFNVLCAAGNFIYTILDDSANVGPDVTFNNCCQATLTLSSPLDNHNNLAAVEVKRRERSDWIKASNIISVGDNALSNGVVYHAENFVELNPGFEAVFGSQFAAYPQGCSANFMYKNQMPQHTETAIPEEDSINLTRIVGGFTIIPNPSSSVIEIAMTDANFKKVSVTTIDGKIVTERTIHPTDKTQLDVSGYANGVYIINVTSDDGQLFTGKLIKN